MILLELKGKKKPYAIVFKSDRSVEVKVSVYERMESKQFYSDLESLVHNYIGERLTKSVISELTIKVSELEASTVKKYD